MMKNRLPPKLPIWLVKASWRATAKFLKIPARSSEEAWEKASKKVLRMEGGISCLEIEVIRRIDETV